MKLCFSQTGSNKPRSGESAPTDCRLWSSLRCAASPGLSSATSAAWETADSQMDQAALKRGQGEDKEAHTAKRRRAGSSAAKLAEPVQAHQICYSACSPQLVRICTSGFSYKWWHQNIYQGISAQVCTLEATRAGTCTCYSTCGTNRVSYHTDSMSWISMQSGTIVLS